ncbi:hypothetical protein RND71_018910 [Anisodus tanguticus]|uniref:Bet v I/Major latex protein domain-containing protein n=1 Tax=Anisodus tanguticus TaxID=243964 RepID=A0AAE1VJV2_9SOLA|nr:hypothetical protein RND71_018910 [Anisodus tanguticus]
MLGTISEEIGVPVPANEAWKIYNTIQLANIIVKELPNIVHKVDILEAQVVEGGLLDLGFILYKVKFEVIEKDKETCITKTTIEYEVKEEEAANASFVSIQPFVAIMNLVAKRLTQSKDGQSYT